MSLRELNLVLSLGAITLVGIAGLCGCAPSTASPSTETGAPEASAEAWAWSAESDCGTCHEAENESLHNASLDAGAHADLPCATCHTDSAALANAHEEATAGAKMPTKLKETAVDQAVCQTSGCHSESLKGLAAKTADSTVLTDSEGTVVNPHEVPTLTDSHIEASLSCVACHPMHQEQDAAQKCGSCHHMDVYECNTCHE